MKEVSTSNFGLVIAFVLPGFTALWGAAYISPVLRLWLVSSETTGPTVGGFLYVTLASVAAGLTVSTVRWAVIDTVHHRTGIPQPTWDFSRLQEHVAAYKVLHEIHYKFYQFNSNTLISLIFVYIARRVHFGSWAEKFGWFDVGLLLLSVIFFFGSRDTLRNFYARVDMLLGDVSENRTREPELPVEHGEVAA